MTNLEQLAKIIWDGHNYNAAYDLALKHMPNSPLIHYTHHTAQAILNAGWTAPPQQTAQWRDYNSPPPPAHNHFTRDIKPPGTCPGCDHN